jgi:hypothetical protein
MKRIEREKATKEENAGARAGARAGAQDHASGGIHPSRLAMNPRLAG